MTTDESTELKLLRQRVSSLATEVRKLQDRQREFKNLQDKHRDLGNRIDKVDDRADELETRLEQLQEDHGRLRAAVRRDIARSAAAVRDLAAKIGWLERRVRAGADDPAVPLDAVDDDLRQLAEQARRGWESEDALLTSAARAAHQQTIHELGRLEQRIGDTAEEALRHAATLADSPPRTARHRAAATEFRAVDTMLADHLRRLPEAQEQARRARQELNTDDEQRQAHGPVMTTGESAAAQLAARLRARLSQAVADAAVLPPWLTFALGHQPVGEDADRWMRLATQLLTYRVLYEVSDPVVALDPGVHDDPRRETWRADLASRIEARRNRG